MTKSQDAGDVIAFLPNTLQDHGNSTAEDVKPQTNKFLDELNAFVPKKKSNGMVCSVQKTLDNLPEAERNKLEELLNNEKILSSDLSILLKKHGYFISGDVIRRHRRRYVSGTGCCCP